MNDKINYETFERYEFKYILNKNLKFLIESDISNFMKLDKFAIKNKGYFVRSLYFDDENSSEYYNKIDGIMNRRKFRLRTYSKNFDQNVPIYIEVKGRNNQRTFKERKKIRLEEVSIYENSLAEKLKEKKNDRISMEFLFQIIRRRIKPKVVTDYWRSPYISDYDRNFRLTFDSFNTITKTNSLFNNNNNFKRHSLPGYSILEIKFNRRIPKWFHRIIQNYNLRRVSISKFCLGMEKADISKKLE